MWCRWGTPADNLFGERFEFQMAAEIQERNVNADPEVKQPLFFQLVMKWVVSVSCQQEVLGYQKSSCGIISLTSSSQPQSCGIVVVKIKKTIWKHHYHQYSMPGSWILCASLGCGVPDGGVVGTCLALRQGGGAGGLGVGFGSRAWAQDLVWGLGPGVWAWDRRRRHRAVRGMHKAWVPWAGGQLTVAHCLPSSGINEDWGSGMKTKPAEWNWGMHWQKTLFHSHYWHLLVQVAWCQSWGSAWTVCS